MYLRRIAVLRLSLIYRQLLVAGLDQLLGGETEFGEVGVRVARKNFLKLRGGPEIRLERCFDERFLGRSRCDGT